MNSQDQSEDIRQRTFNVLALASKGDLPRVRRELLPGLTAADLDPGLLAEFLEHPNRSISGIVGELMLFHFPHKLKYEALVHLGLSPNRTISWRATELEISNFSRLIDTSRLKDLKRRHPSSAVKAAADTKLDRRAEAAFMRGVERRIAAEKR